MRINCEREFDRTNEDCLDCGAECDGCGELVCWNEANKDGACYYCDECAGRADMSISERLREVGMSEWDFFSGRVR